MYIDDISSQLQVFLYSVGFGFILGLIYDILRIFRISVIKTNKAVYLQDIAYFLLCSVLTFMFLLVVNNGRFRFNILVALLSGFTVYYLSVGRFLTDITVVMLVSLKSFFVSSARIITAPYRLISRLFGKINLKLPEKFKIIKKTQKISKKTLENEE